MLVISFYTKMLIFNTSTSSSKTEDEVFQKHWN